MKTPAWLKRWRVSRRIRAYRKHGSIPWSRGYEEFREHMLAEALHLPAFGFPALPAQWGIGLDERIVEIPWFFSRLKGERARLLDAGSTLNHEICLTHPLMKNRKIHICTLAPEANCFWKQGISYLFEDLRKLPYQDESFDEIACISVLEHVGMDNTRHYTQDSKFKEATPDGAALAIREFYRLLRPGGKLYLTVPFGRAVSHGWLRIFDRFGLEKLLEGFRADRKEISLYRYLPQGWQACPMEEASEAIFFDVHAGKPWSIGQPASSGAICCAELSKAG